MTDDTGAVIEQPRLPARAYKMARRMLDLEKQNGGRARVTIDVLFLDGEWWIDVITPGKLERLGE